MESEDTPPSNSSKEGIKILQKSTLVSIISTSGNVMVLKAPLLWYDSFLSPSLLPLTCVFSTCDIAVP